MTQAYFEPPLFIKEGKIISVNLSVTPVFCNIGGHPAYVCELPDGMEMLQPQKGDAGLVLGNKYRVSAAHLEKTDPQYGEQTRLTFATQKVVYQPLWATRKTAAAFGMTLVEKGQGICMRSPQPHLAQIDYEYGMFAGHRSPYQGTGYQLLGAVCTDLEHHDFPHVFASVDPSLPLVISVGRYWPQQDKIYLADLWVPCGSALYVPPRPQLIGQRYLDLHGNRNSALACWRGIGQASVKTQTLLQTKDSFFHWFWNDLPSIHPLLE